MEGTSSQLNRQWLEFAIWSIINEYNIKQEQTSEIIQVSEANVLRDEVEDLIIKQGYTMSTTPARKVSAICWDVFSTRCDYDKKSIIEKSLQNSLELFKTLINDKQEYGATLESVGISSNGVLPISPLDPRYRDLEVSRVNGLSPLFLQNVSSFDILDDFEKLKITPVSTMNRTLNINNGYSTISKLQITKSLTGEQNFVRNLDTTGLTKLLPFMNNKKSKILMDWVFSGNKPNTIVAESDIQNRNIQLDKSVAILNYLEDEGINYEILPDSNPGQLKAVLKPSNITVRILDTIDSAHYVGRVYDNGNVYTFSTTRVNTVDGKTVTARHNPTPEDCVDLLKFALGKGAKPHTGTYERFINGKKTKVNSSYITPQASVVTIKDLVDNNGNVDKYGNKVKIQIAQAQGITAEVKVIKNVETATDYLHDIVNEASDEIRREVKVDELINAVESYRDELDKAEIEGLSTDIDFTFKFSLDPALENIQRAYYSLLMGEVNTLYKPQTIGTDNVEAYDGQSNIDDIYLHLDDYIQHEIGSFDVDEFGKRFNVSNVAKYGSGSGIYKNINNIVTALRMLDIPVQELKGDDNHNTLIGTRLIKFNEENNGRLDNLGKMSTENAPFNNENIQSNESTVREKFIEMLNTTIKQTLDSYGVEVKSEDILIDASGIIKYTGIRRTKERSSDEDYLEVVGEIGQVFFPDELGMITTEFNGGNNYSIVPGYTATLQRQKVGESKSFNERLLLKGYTQLMKEKIEYSLATQMKSRTSYQSDTTVLNGVYGQLYGTRYDVNFKQEFLKLGVAPDLIESILKSQSQRMLLSGNFNEDTIGLVEYGMATLDVIENDSINNPLAISEGKEIVVLDNDGPFDKDITNVTTTKQGFIRFLKEGSVVDESGHIIESTIPDDSTTLMKHDVMKYAKYSGVDRANMSFSNLLHMRNFAPKANTAQMTLGGWNLEDGIVVSLDFAQKYNLSVGDKMCDLHGNKGVIGLIVDRNMRHDIALQSDIADVVDVFALNPSLDVIVSPMSGISRTNMGTAREGIDNVVTDFYDLDGVEHKSAISGINWIITEQSGEYKTNIYDNKAYQEGKGRNIGPQFLGACAAKGVKQFISKNFKYNAKGLENLREYLITIGYDLTQYGEIKFGYTAHPNEYRPIIEQPLVEFPLTTINRKNAIHEFTTNLDRQGGFLELPFDLTFMNNQKTIETPNGRDILLPNGEWKNMKTFTLPVMSSLLRSGQTFESGASSTHDYTKHYATIYEQALLYEDTLLKLSNPSLTRSEQIELEKIMLGHQNKAQAAFDKIQNDIVSRKFETKNNIFKKEISAARVQHSGTVIVTPDPRLKLDEVRVSPNILDKLGMKEGDLLLAYRDPILRDGGIRYLKTVSDPALVGIAINPVISLSFEGDFDGDTYGIIFENDPKVQKELYDAFYAQNNLLDLGAPGKDGRYNLYFHDSQEIQIANYKNPDLAKKFVELRERANENLNEVDVDKKTAENAKILDELSGYYKEVFSKTVGYNALSFDSKEAYMDGLQQIVDTGAKGSNESIELCNRYLDGEKSRFDDENQFGALAVKSYGVGFAGAVQQAFLKVAKDYEYDDTIVAKSVMELTRPVTQALLQAKKDATHAKFLFETIKGPAMSAFTGKRVVVDVANKTFDEFNEDITFDEWKSQIKDIYKTLKVSVDDKYLDTFENLLVIREGDRESVGNEDKIGKVRNLKEIQYDEHSSSLVGHAVYGKDTMDMFNDAATKYSKDPNNTVSIFGNGSFTGTLVPNNINHSFNKTSESRLKKQLELVGNVPNVEKTEGTVFDNDIRNDIPEEKEINEYDEYQDQDYSDDGYSDNYSEFEDELAQRLEEEEYIQSQYSGD